MKDPSWCKMFHDRNFAFTLPFLVVLLGLPIPALAQPTINFGQQLVGTTSSPQQVPGCCFNSNYGSSVDLGISISGDFRRDPHTTCGFSLGPTQSCVIWVAFAPQQVGTRTGQVTTSAVVTY